MPCLMDSLLRRPVAWTACACMLALTGAVVWLILTLPARIDPRLQENAVAASSDLRTAAHHFADAGKNLSLLTAALADARTGVARTLRNVNIVTAQVGRTSNVARLASSEQRVYLQQLSQEADSTLRSANALLSGADRNLNQGALPALTEGLNEFRASVAGLTSDGHVALGAATGALNAAAGVMADPSIPAATRSLANAGAHLNGTSANIEQATGYLRDMFKPTKQSFWKTLVLGNLPSVLLHFLPQRTTVVNEPTVKTEAK